MTLFLQAAALGFLVAFPVGPIAALILQRSLQVGFWAGFASGIGAAFADALFAFLAGLGLSALVQEVSVSHQWIRVIGALVLVILGLRLFFQKPPSLQTDEILSDRYLHHYLWDALSVFLLTLTNPMTIIAFGALFAGSHLIPFEARELDFIVVTSGVWAGSFIWWLALTFLAQPIKKGLSARRLHRLLQAIGVLLIGLGIVSGGPLVGSLIDKTPFFRGR